MKNRDLLAGLVIVALLVAGALWVRNRQAGTGSAVRAAAIAPDVTQTDGFVELNGVRVGLSLSSRPPVAFTTFRAQVRLAPPAMLEEGRISFEMSMPMGDHRYTLVRADDGWQAEVVLPMCGSGERRWTAVVEGRVNGRPIVARYLLDLAPARSK